MKIVLDIGGSIVASPAPNVPYIKGLAELLIELQREGHRVMVVVGGGRLARDYVAAARELGGSEDYCDEVGIGATRMNAMLLIAAMGKHAVKALRMNTLGAAKAKKVLVMGGTKPRQTTDAVSAQLAWRTHADLLVVATNVDGVYDSDPKVNPKAKKLPRVTPQQLVKLVSTKEYRAGSTAVVDPVAARIIERNRIRTIVLDGRRLENIRAAVSGGEHGGTVVG